MDAAVIINQPQKMEQISEIDHADLSSFAMLLLEPEHKIDLTPPYSGGHKMTHREDQSSNAIRISQPRSTDVSLNTPSNTPVNTHLTNASGIRSLFRKRHKSIGGQPPQLTIVSSPTGYQGPPSAPINGSKVRSLFNSNRPKLTKNDNCDVNCNKRPMSEVAIDIDDDCAPSRNDTGYGSFPRNILSPSSPPTPINIYQSTTPSGSRHLHHANSCSYQRQGDAMSPKATVGSVGPSDFVEMFRSRAYSDTGLPDAIGRMRMHRTSIGSITSQSSISADYCPFEPRQVIIWKDQINGTQVFRLPSTEEDEALDITPSKAGVFDNLVYQRFLKSHSCYDVIPTSIKMVILDTQLTVKKAFLALVENGVMSAPLWESRVQDFIGMLTVTDFIMLMLKCHNNKQSIIEASENNTLSHWADILLDGNKICLLTLPADATLLEAVEIFVRDGVHRLPVIDSHAGNIIYVLTPKCILRYMFLFFQHYSLSQPPCMQKSLKDLNLVAEDNFATIQANTSLVKALTIMVAKKISSLPIVDAGMKLVGLFNKSHMIAAVSDNTFKDLNMTVWQAINGKVNDQVFTCNKNELYSTIVDRLVRNDTQQLIIIDEEERVKGVLSVMDVVKHLVLDAETRRPSSGRGSTSGDHFEYFSMI